jgi:hypothetical protein
MAVPTRPSPKSVEGENRWIAIGTSQNPDATAAVAECTAPILAHGQPKLTVIFCSTALDPAAVAHRVQEAVGESLVIGCTTAGELTRDRATSGGLLLWALGGEGFSVTTGAGLGSPSLGLRQAAHRAALCLESVKRRRHTLLLLLADGLCGDQMEVVRGAYEVSGAQVPLVGGCAADDMALKATHQFHGSEILRHAVVAAAISSDAPMAVGIAHGWESFGQAMLVTNSQGTVLQGLDDRPALDVYFDAFQAPAEVRDNPAAFFDFAHTRPIGIVRRDRMEIRYVCGADYQKRTITIFAEIPQGAKVYLMRGSCTSVLHATAEVCEQAERDLGQYPAKGFLLLECVARKSLLDQAGLLQESLRFPALPPQAVLGGFYTYGEIARSEGAGGLHNQTVVALALA